MHAPVINHVNLDGILETLKKKNEEVHLYCDFINYKDPDLKHSIVLSDGNV